MLCSNAALFTIFGYLMIQVMFEEGGAAAKLRNNRRPLPSDPWQLFNISIRANNNRTEGLFPNVFNLAAVAKISSNATCGQDGGPEQFCKLVEHVKRRPGDRIQCGVCYADSGRSQESHPISNAIDGTHSWWQSPTITNGWNFNWVTITLDLQQLYQVAYIIVKAANSPRPGNWILERSLDGITYSPWQYFALTNSECLNTYRVAATGRIPRYKRDNDVICTAAFSKLDPLENGEIYVSLVNGRPGVSGPSRELIEFTTARFVRLRLQRIRTLNADLMLPFHYNLKYLDPTVTNRYYYSIKDISIGGQCICYGHARYCPVDSVSRELKCKCEGNTCGKSCETCCPLFNQFPWRQGTYTERAACEECNCFGHAESCIYNSTVHQQKLSLDINGIYNGGGVCIDCKHHTMGINCELCADGFYRPSGLDHSHPEACQPCLCDGFGATGLCIKDETDEDIGLMAGDCTCREGYCGLRCDQCSPGFSGYPNCMRCPCSQAGSLNEDLCAKCTCKENVCGDNCDTCLPGFFNLRTENPDGCDPCFCFSITEKCQSSTWGRSEVKTMHGWLVTDEANAGSIVPTVSSDLSLHFTRQRSHHPIGDMYWLAPADYIGNKVTSYGGVLKYTFHYFVDHSLKAKDPDSHLNKYVVILEGSGMRLGFVGSHLEEEAPHIITVSLTESGWIHLGNSTSIPGTTVSRDEFMVILAEVDRLLLRSSYSKHQTEMMLLDITLDVASDGGTGPLMSSVEMCQCPDGYAGTSCETCATGYRRVDNILVGGMCVPCECNGHSEFCDPYTGECQDCQHNTFGSRCEFCASGYVGDARLGSIDGCRPCACPHETNNFAESCRVVTDSRGHVNQICLDCKSGHTGTHCELCVKGYYGNPVQTGVGCRPCDCNENAADTGEGPCDPVSGHCYHCTGHTEGFDCGRCQDGYFGTAFRGNCTKCQCSQHGSVGSLCNSLTGQCQCQPRYAGLNCDQCQAGYGDIRSGCLPCNCNPSGSQTGSVCDPVTGRCSCKEGVTGSSCSECMPGYYSFSPSGCQVCSCHSHGARSLSCDRVTGECLCHENVLGRLCDQCQSDHWGINSGHGCQPCNCNMTGSRLSQCSVDTGACNCKPGVTGRSCDQCSPGYFGFSSVGCRNCKRCQKPGHVCDPNTGRCVCPPLTEGEQCQRCQLNTWGYNAVNGCQACDCSLVGSSGPQCHPVSGQCSCTAGHFGQKCDRCPLGYFGFPTCIPCQCDVRGTVDADCKDGLCSCHVTTGQCPCKENAFGKRCDSCKESTFGLAAANPSGCFACFCFGRSQNCTQAPYTWSQVYFKRQTVTVDVNGKESLPSSGFVIIPENVSLIKINSRQLQLPLFWNLTSFVTGDKTLSYNGRFQFKLDVHSRTRTPSTVAVHITGNNQLRIMHKFNGAAGKLLDYSVVLKEDYWTDDRKHPVTQSQMMVALQNVQQWLIQVSEESGFVLAAKLYDITLDQAVPADQQNFDAYGIEMCVCPKPYTGLSCQDPGDGFYRRRPDTTDLITDPVELIGTSVPCQCHGRSNACDRDNGKCQNCSDNTGGDHCEACKVGFYNAFHRRSELRCEPCACPRVIPSNNFSPSCIPSTLEDGFVCDSCSEGYAGPRCERCSSGYFGDPLVIGGDGCQPCLCHATGSRDQQCDSVTGRCSCHEGITGRTCDQCQPRFGIAGGKCISCDEGCTGEVMSLLNATMKAVDGFNSTATALLPWARISNIELTAVKLQKAMMFLNATDLKEIVEAMPSLTVQAERLKLKAEELSMIAATEEKSSTEMKNELAKLLHNVDKATEFAKDTVVDVVSLMRTNQSGGSNITEMYEKSNEFLRLIKSVHFNKTTVTADEELRLAKELLQKVERISTASGVDLSPVTLHHQSLEDRLTDLNRILRDLGGQIKNTSATNALLHVMLDILKEQNNNLSADSLLTSELCKIAAEKNDLASRLLSNVTKESFKEIQALVKEFLQKNDELLEKKDQIEKDVASSNALIAEMSGHAKGLKEQAERLEKQFSGTRHTAEDPLKAATGYEEIKRTVEEAEMAAKKAREAAIEAYEKITLNAIRNQSAESLNRSKLLLANANELLANISDKFKKNVEERVSVLNEASSNVHLVRDSLAEFEQMLNMTPKGLQDTIQEISYRTAVSLEKSSKAEKLVTNRTKSLHSELKPQLDEIKILASDGMIQLNESVLTAGSQIDGLVNNTLALYRHKNKIQQLGSDIRDNILKLRRMIEEAQAQANSIKVSLYHQGQCIRKYAVPNRSSLINNVTLHFRTNSTNTDQLLFLLRAKNNSDFLAIEMVDQRIHFVWNAGGETMMVEHEERIESYFGKTDEKDMWYRVHAEKVGNVGRLSVNKLSSSPNPDQVAEASTSHNSIRSDLVDDVDLFIAGVPSDYEAPEELMSSSFDGCIGAVEVDGQTLGLFNFRKLVQKVNCHGCSIAPVVDESSQLIYQFNGRGYASLPQVRYSPEILRVSFKFKSFWKDALLFYTANDITGDFLSIELQNGRVVFQFGFMGKIDVRLSTQLLYNTNEWTLVRASRNKHEGILEVEKEKLNGSSSAGVFTMDLAKSLMFFAGVPLDVKTEKYNITRLGFLGCLRETMVVSRGPYIKDFLDGIYVGMSLGCHSKASVIGLPGSGHIELTSVSIPNEGGVAVSFRTLQSDALILLAIGSIPNHFYSISLTDGKVSAWLNAGSGAVRVTSESRYNDSKAHSAVVRKHYRLVELYVDDALVGSDTLPPNSGTVNGTRESDGGLYVGGIPFGVSADQMSASVNPFRGCLFDLLINNRAVPFDMPFAFDSVDVGRCMESDIFTNLTDPSLMKISSSPTIPSFTVTVTVPVVPVASELMTPSIHSKKPVIPTQEPLTCATEADFSYVTNAVSFGDICYSNAEIEMEKINVAKFSLSMLIRTYYSKGQIFYIGNKNQIDFVSLHLLNGTLRVVYMGTDGKAKEISSDLTITDGLWHNLGLAKSSTSISLQVDEAEPVVAAVSQEIIVLSPIYIGGLPKEFKVHKSVLHESLKGCVRNFEVNGQLIDIANSKVIMGVRQCFSRSEPGVHFDGYGYALFAKQYRIDSHLSLSFEFRTTRQNGVIFSISHLASFPALALEMLDGKIVFTAANLENPYSTESELCSYCLCDDKWHSVHAELVRNVVRLQVDGGRPTVRVGSENEMNLGINSELYIGGSPVYALPQMAAHTSEFFQGCLRNVRINGTLVDWHSVDSLIDVHVSGCPISEPLN